MFSIFRCPACVQTLLFCLSVKYQRSFSAVYYHHCDCGLSWIGSCACCHYDWTFIPQ